MTGILEQQRLRALHALAILDTEPEFEFDELVELAAAICATPISAITLIDADRQWMKAATGMPPTELPRELAFCDYMIRNDDTLLVEDATTDERFRENPLVTGAPGVRFYAGVPVRSAGGLPLGGFCVVDTKPRQISLQQRQALTVLARQAAARMELRMHRRTADAAMTELRRYQTDLEDANARLRQLSLSDALTGLANRRAFEERLSAEFSRSLGEGSGLALLMIDVDNFKRVNDLFGHGYGDEVLQRVGAGIARSTRMLDLPVRYGGEEFAVLMPKTQSSGATAVADRIRHELRMESWDDRTVTVSIGIALQDSSMHREAALVASADHALYQAKAAGKDRYMIYKETVAEHLIAHLGAAPVVPDLLN